MREHFRKPIPYHWLVDESKLSRDSLKMSSVLSDSIEMRKAAREHYSTFKVTGFIQLNFMRKLLKQQQ